MSKINDFEIKLDDYRALIYKENFYLELQTVGENAIRVRASKQLDSLEEKNVNLKYENHKNCKLYFEKKEENLVFINNKLQTKFDGNSLTFNNGIDFLKEYSKVQNNVRRTMENYKLVPLKDIEESFSLNIGAYEFLNIGKNICKANLRFYGDKNEKIFGMGGYQSEKLNKNGQILELMQRNSQTTMPAYLSNKGYGFIWNSPAVGKVFFGNNEFFWESFNSDIIDYTIVIGENPKEIIETISSFLGKAPMIDKSLLGLWQSKLRYQTSEELLDVYQKYLSKNIIPSVMVIDYFHWTEEGDFKFDDKYWKNIKEVADFMHKNGTKLMVSVWPTVARKSENFQYYNKNSLLLDGENSKIFNGKYILDFSKKLANEFVVDKLQKNYIDKGVDLFWADQAEPEMDEYNHFNYGFSNENMSKNANLYPIYYAKTISSVTNQNYPTLIRSSWLGSQKYGTLLWSGDIDSTFSSLKRQIQFAISVGLSGQSWWTSDIGGFHSGNSESDYFRQLLIRWFQFAVFSPILRMHGDRQPHFGRIGNSGGGVRTSGSANEIWSFGPEVERILISYTKLREDLIEYIYNLYKEASDRGLPLVRPLFLEYPNIEETWDERYQYFFGEDLIICPVTNYNIKEMDVLIPDDNWVDAYTKNKALKGKNKIKLNLEVIPIFIKENSKYFDYISSAFDKLKEDLNVVTIS
ncbi:glycosyl hydrolase family 31 [Anaerococcus sp. WCA-380-WT-2B]|uniref:Glycosyl hydrolase family 31 n=1 Tax=Anaerococcus porci TaxID=2652269 RepID=A0A6N7VEI1_9FIRM|nr:TIM-barrel domain-containing protein [Anaerococcus porci]MSS77825.1 glycosyl hydrolase family 31 [Anaerococcus porci]